MRKKHSVDETVQKATLFVDNTETSHEAERILDEFKIPYRRIDLTLAKSYDEDIAPPTILGPYGQYSGLEGVQKYASFASNWVRKSL